MSDAMQTSTYEVRLTFADSHKVIEVEATDIINAFKVARRLHPKAIVVSDTAV